MPAGALARTTRDIMPFRAGDAARRADRSDPGGGHRPDYAEAHFAAATHVSEPEKNVWGGLGAMDNTRAGKAAARKNF